ncbi:two-component system response regulator [Desulfobacter hydrogenophilus]|uniref:Response regulator n=1 Tax=Desulfobacter hydrogenophilus TaxID=2291 RepID=A0A328FHG2_9BACT|nr:HD domain-containing phosphohydrolase [Desulfobacter hydrogenophilus]NDY71057.1 response regulator [Desulfobacter hydrogenophilus]QBH11699.1 response regulator [Desulfobacter hydrogenophilus]RAM02912.1 two-component system response regulator [Desulfobacter hydrogenophilus]
MTENEITSGKKISVLVVDDEKSILKLIQRLVRQEGYDCLIASNGLEAITVMEETVVDVVITDIAMPKMDGIELTKQIKENYSADVIMMTGYFKDLSYENAVTKGAKDFIQKPFSTKEFQIRLNRVIKERETNQELKKSLERMNEIVDGVINSLSLTVDARDPYTAGHQKRVAQLAIEIARSMGLGKTQISSIRMAGILHDLGKIAIPAEILSKPSMLSDIEFRLIKTHPQVGYDILKNINFPTPVARIVHQHHERMDGSGYPLGLAGDDILPEARILMVADVVEAMFSHRPYRPGLGMDKALAEIKKNRGKFYDPDVVDACLKTMAENFKFDG